MLTLCKSHTKTYLQFATRMLLQKYKSKSDCIAQDFRQAAPRLQDIVTSEGNYFFSQYNFNEYHPAFFHI